ncbi:MAG: hypothetical protein L6R40_007108 [Gallowayella cf. fulva]|nr:MAG: hypothetical protein L6R40_007108 [Xanthomendoza cf. fulva]
MTSTTDIGRIEAILKTLSERLEDLKILFETDDGGAFDRQLIQHRQFDVADGLTKMTSEMLGLRKRLEDEIKCNEETAKTLADDKARFEELSAREKDVAAAQEAEFAEKEKLFVREQRLFIQEKRLFGKEKEDLFQQQQRLKEDRKDLESAKHRSEEDKAKLEEDKAKLEEGRTKLKEIANRLISGTSFDESTTTVTNMDELAERLTQNARISVGKMEGRLQNHLDKLLASGFSKSEAQIQAIANGLSDDIENMAARLPTSGHDNAVMSSLSAINEHLTALPPTIEHVRRGVASLATRIDTPSPAQSRLGKRASDASLVEQDPRKRRTSAQESPRLGQSTSAMQDLGSSSSATQDVGSSGYQPPSSSATAEPVLAPNPLLLGATATAEVQQIWNQIEFAGDGWTDENQSKLLGYIAKEVRRPYKDTSHPVTALDNSARSNIPQCPVSRWRKVPMTLKNPAEAKYRCGQCNNTGPCIQVSFSSPSFEPFQATSLRKRWSLKIRPAP